MRKDNGWLFDASSWFLSFKSGMTSASFQTLENVDEAKKQLMITVRGPRITGKLSLITRIETLSLPGDLFEGIDNTIFLILEQ